MKKLINITELAKKLNLIDPITKKPLNHTLRYWEKEFKQIRPRKIKNRRYYPVDQIEKIKLIKFLIRDKGVSILGVKNILNQKKISLDGDNIISLKNDFIKKKIKLKSKIIFKKLKKIKSYGKKHILKFVWFQKVIQIVSLFTMQRNPQRVRRLKIN